MGFFQFSQSDQDEPHALDIVDWSILFLWLLLGAASLIMFVIAQAGFPTAGFPRLDFALGNRMTALEGNDIHRSLCALMSITSSFGALTYYFGNDGRTSMVSAVAFLAMPTTGLAFVVATEFVFSLATAIGFFCLVVGIYRIIDAAALRGLGSPFKRIEWPVSLALMLPTLAFLGLLQFLTDGLLISLADILEMSGPAVLILALLVLYRNLARLHSLFWVYFPVVLIVALACFIIFMRSYDLEMGWRRVEPIGITPNAGETALAIVCFVCLWLCAIFAVPLIVEANTYATEEGETMFDFEFPQTAMRFLDRFTLSILGFCTLGGIAFVIVGQIFAGCILVSLGFARCIALLDEAARFSAGAVDGDYPTARLGFTNVRLWTRLGAATIIASGGILIFVSGDFETGRLFLLVFCATLLAMVLIGLFLERARLFYVATMSALSTVSWLLLTSVLPGFVQDTYPVHAIAQAIAPYKTCGSAVVVAQDPLSSTLASLGKETPPVGNALLQGHSALADFGQTTFFLRQAPQKGERVLNTITRLDWQKNRRKMVLVAKPDDISKRCMQWMTIGYN